MATRERPRHRTCRCIAGRCRWSLILHRATGIVLVVGLAGLVGLLALAAGPQRWAAFAACAGSPFGKIVLLGFSWALAFHLINGIPPPGAGRGAGLRDPGIQRSSWLSVIGSFVLVALARRRAGAWGHA